MVLSGDVGIRLDELQNLLKQLESSNLETRIRAATEIKKNAAGCEGVFRKALFNVGFVQNAEIKDTLKKANSDAGEYSNGFGVSALVQMNPSDPSVALSTKVVVMLMALHSLDTMAGYKVLLDFSSRHAGAFRALIGKMIVHSGLKALPALIYGRGSKKQELHMFSVAWVREMGNPLLSEQIQGIHNSRRLAQLLEAYASVNDLDAIDVTLSCANHESGFVRNAARASLAVYGKNAKWSIHREYENTFGDEPSGNDYQQWAADLYQHWDEERDAQTKAAFQKGIAAAKAGDFKTMDNAFRSLLSANPLYPRRFMMAPGYLRYAAMQEEEGRHDQAILLNRMAKRLAKEESEAYLSAQARLDWLVAESFREGGGLDTTGYKRLAQIEAVRGQALQWAEYASAANDSPKMHWFKIFWVSLFVFLAGLLIYMRVQLSA